MQGQSLFGVHQIPSDNQIRDILELITPRYVSKLFWQAYAQLQSARVLARAAQTKGLKSAQSDLRVAAYLAEAATRGALLNAKENLAAMTDEAVVSEYQARVAAVEEAAIPTG